MCGVLSTKSRPGCFSFNMHNVYTHMETGRFYFRVYMSSQYVIHSRVYTQTYKYMRGVEIVKSDRERRKRTQDAKCSDSAFWAPVPLQEIFCQIIIPRVSRSFSFPNSPFTYFTVSFTLIVFFFYQGNHTFTVRCFCSHWSLIPALLQTFFSKQKRSLSDIYLYLHTHKQPEKTTRTV